MTQLSFTLLFPYSFSGAKLSDLRAHIPHILQRHPTAHTVILHGGINDIKDRCVQSAALYSDYKALAREIKNQGKCCLFSGLIPTLHKSPELFGRIYSAHNWLRNFCHIEGYEYCSNFDIFWKNPVLYRDALHPNNEGIKGLANNIASHLAIE